MIIHCLFIVRDGAPIPELLVAWDEFMVEENLQGWEKDCRDTLAAVGSEVQRSAYIDIRVDGVELEKRLVYASELDGAVVPSQEAS